MKKTQTLLNEMTDVEKDYHQWSLDHRKKNGLEVVPAGPMVYVRLDNSVKIILEMTHSEKFAREYASQHCRSRFVLMLADGVEAYCDESATRIMLHGNYGVGTAGCWPMSSYAAGIDVDEIPEFRKIDKAGGVPTEYTTGENGGDPIFTSKKHRRDYFKLHNLYDRNAGYSDVGPSAGVRPARRQRCIK